VVFLSIAIIVFAYFWLLGETDWLRIRLPSVPESPHAPETRQELAPQAKEEGVRDVGIFLALCGVTGPLILVAMDLVAALTQPKYSLVHDSISALALTSIGWIQTTGFMLIGLLIEAFTAGLFLNIKRRRGFGFGITLLAFFGFGMLVLGVFHINAVGTPATFYSQIHITAAYSVLGLFPVALALMFSSIKNDPRWRALFPYTVGAAVFALTVAVGRLFLPAGFSWFGLYERVMVLNAISWLEVFAIGLLHLSFLRQRVARQRQSISMEEGFRIDGTSAEFLYGQPILDTCIFASTTNIKNILVPPDKELGSPPRM
jgi:hypothetical protein